MSTMFMSKGPRLVEYLKEAYFGSRHDSLGYKLRTTQDIHNFLYQAVRLNQWEDLLGFVEALEVLCNEVTLKTEKVGLPDAVRQIYFYIKGTLYSLQGFSESTLGKLYVENLNVMSVGGSVYNMLTDILKSKDKKISVSDLHTKIQSVGLSGNDKSEFIILLCKMHLLQVALKDGEHEVFVLGQQAPLFLDAYDDSKRK